MTVIVALLEILNDSGFRKRGRGKSVASNFFHFSVFFRFFLKKKKKKTGRHCSRDPFCEAPNNVGKWGWGQISENERGEGEFKPPPPLLQRSARFFPLSQSPTCYQKGQVGVGEIQTSCLPRFTVDFGPRLLPTHSLQPVLRTSDVGGSES